MPSWLGAIYPLIQAPMAGAQDSRMAIAVSQAGAVGSLPGALLAPDKLAQEIQAIANAVAIYNVNFFAHRLPEITPEQEARWLSLLAPYFKFYQLDASNLNPGPVRQPFSEKELAVLQRFRPKIVSFHFGLPEEGLLEAVRATGAKILASATSVREALYLARRQVDAVIAQGSEAGGHRGMFLETDVRTQTGAFALLPQIAAALKPYRIPVIAAGGIADAVGVQAALALGAAGVQVGTAYLRAPESLISPMHRRLLEHAQAQPETVQTILTNLFSGRPARSLMTPFIEALGAMHEDVLAFPFAGLAIAAIKEAAQAGGELDGASFWCGQNPSGCLNASAADTTFRLTRAWS